MTRPVAVLLTAVSLIGSLAQVSFAQEPTPSAGALECTVESYDLSAIFDRSEATPSISAAITTDGRPSGVPASAESSERATQVIELLIGCVNLGYQFKWLFLFTPEYLAILLAETLGAVTVTDIEQLNRLAANERPSSPLPESEQTLLFAVRDVEILPDQRLITTVESDDLSAANGPSERYFFLRDVDGRLLIDGVIDPSRDGTPTA